MLSIALCCGPIDVNKTLVSTCSFLNQWKCLLIHTKLFELKSKGDDNTYVYNSDAVIYSSHIDIVLTKLILFIFFAFTLPNLF